MKGEILVGKGKRNVEIEKRKRKGINVSSYREQCRRQHGCRPWGNRWWCQGFRIRGERWRVRSPWWGACWSLCTMSPSLCPHLKSRMRDLRTFSVVVSTLSLSLPMLFGVLCRRRWLWDFACEWLFCLSFFFFLVGVVDKILAFSRGETVFCSVVCIDWIQLCLLFKFHLSMLHDTRQS